MYVYVLYSDIRLCNKSTVLGCLQFDVQLPKRREAVHGNGKYHLRVEVRPHQPANSSAGPSAWDSPISSKIREASAGTGKRHYNDTTTA